MLPRLPIPYPFYRPAGPDAPRHDIWRSHDDKSLRVLADIAEEPGDLLRWEILAAGAAG